ncbi:MAG: serine dehydratase subunit alpha family protein, partial [Anaerovoracaceae bacterium]
MLSKEIKNEFIKIIREELVPAMGCTEPIALAYASARGREVLGKMPERIDALCSGNMIKNVRCVTIPNSGGMTGIETACILGAAEGNPGAGMEVLES